MTETSLIPAEKKELTELEKIKKEEMEKAFEGIDPVMPKIRILRENQMFMDVDDKSFKEFEGVILFSQKIRGCWLDEMGKVPLCSSKTGFKGEMSQDIERINPDVTTILERAENANFICSACGNNKWGSNPKKKKGKACTEKRRSLILTTIGIFPYILEAPTSSMKKWDTYVSGVAQKGNPAISVLTNFSLEKLENPQKGHLWSGLILTKIRELTAEEAKYAITLRKKFSEAVKGVDVESEEHYNSEREKDDTSFDPEKLDKQKTKEEKPKEKGSGSEFIDELEKEKQERIMAETKEKADKKTKEMNEGK